MAQTNRSPGNQGLFNPCNKAIVRWVDQQANYQQRSDPAMVKAAWQEHLG